MPEYRLYIMSVDGHILNGIDLVCDDDAAAIAAVETRGETAPLELWRGHRQVKVFPKRRESDSG